MAALTTVTDSSEIKLKDVIDLEKYPIDKDLNSPSYMALIEKCRAAMDDLGSCSLPGFIKAEVIAQMTAEVAELPAHNRLEVSSFLRHGQKNGCASADDDAVLASDHPLNRKFVQDIHAVAADIIPRTSLIQQVYDSNMVTAFIAAVLGIDKLYHMADEFQSLNIMRIHDGGNRCWHFDGSDYVVTLMMQQADTGGEFEYARNVWPEGCPATSRPPEQTFDTLKRVLDGQYPTVLSKVAPGTINLFRGNRSLHRVRTAFGPKKRIVAVLSYDRQPGVVGTQDKNIALYGDRVRQIYASRNAAITSST